MADSAIALRRVESEEDADVFLAIRRAIDSEHMPSRAAYLEHVKAPGRIDLIAELEREPVGTGFVERHGDDPSGPEGWVSVRVLAEFRRRGVGSALFQAVSEHARRDGRRALTMSVQEVDRDSIVYLANRGYAEVMRVQESVLDLAAASSKWAPPAGVDLVPIDAELEPAVFETAVEIARDIPSADEVRIDSIDQWRSDQLSALAMRECCFAALVDGEVVGYATLIAGAEGEGMHAMTGVRRPWRRRGIALALKQAQIDAAKTAGLRRLRAANAVQNPMLAVNERLGYRKDVVWLHLRGPLLDAGAP